MKVSIVKKLFKREKLILFFISFLLYLGISCCRPLLGPYAYMDSFNFEIQDSILLDKDSVIFVSKKGNVLKSFFAADKSNESNTIKVKLPVDFTMMPKESLLVVDTCGKKILCLKCSHLLYHEEYNYYSLWREYYK